MFMDIACCLRVVVVVIGGCDGFFLASCLSAGRLVGRLTGWLVGWLVGP